MEPVLPRQHQHQHLVPPFNASTYGRWNTTSSQSLQITIVPAGQAPALSQLAGGPIFTATIQLLSQAHQPLRSLTRSIRVLHL